MQSLSEDINHKQRILFYGTNAKELVDASSKILTSIDKQHDVLLKDNHQLSEAPLVLIENQHELYDHHILAVGELNDEMQSQLESLADRTPKAGSIVYNEKDKTVAKVCKKDREDVIKLPYKPGKGDHDPLAMVKALLTRLRVPENVFSQALDTL